MEAKPNIIILGAGPNVGLAVAKYFKSKEWTVTAVARNPNHEVKNCSDLTLSADFNNPESLKPVFEQSIKAFGPPSAVLYNAYVFKLSKISDPIMLATADMQDVMTVSALSAYEAARLAVESWRNAKFPAGSPMTPTFMFTGNMEISQLHPLVLALGMAKNAAGYMIETAATAYHGKYRFYYVDERTPDGESTFQDIDGPAHGVECWDLVHGKAEIAKGIALGAGKGQGEWAWTFVKGHGYLRCKDVPNRELRASLIIPGFE